MSLQVDGRYLWERHHASSSDIKADCRASKIKSAIFIISME
jgi:hypothetical protein